MAPSLFLLQGGVVRSKLATITYKEHRTGFSHTGPPFFIRERPVTITTTTLNTSTNTTDMYETDVTEYRVDDRVAQTEYVRDSHKTPAPTPPRASHVQIDFETFDKTFLRAMYPRARSDELARDALNSDSWKRALDRYKEGQPNIERADPNFGSGVEPRAALMELFNAVNSAVQESRNPPHYQTSLKYQFAWSPRGDPGVAPVLPPCLATSVTRGIPDLLEWGSAVLFVDVRADTSSYSPAGDTDTNRNGTGRHVSVEPPADGSRPPSSKAKGKRKAVESSPAPPSKRTKRGSTPVRGAGKAAPAAGSSTLAPVPEADATANTEMQPAGAEGPYTGPTYVAEDVGMSRYALETMSALGNRRHIIAMLATGFDLQFFYFDHAGSIRTRKLNLWKDAEKVAAAIINISLLTPEQLGLQAMTGPDPAAPKSMFRSVRGCEVSVDGMRYRIHEVMHRDRNLYGRGGVIYSAWTQHAADEEDDESVVHDPKLDDQQMRDLEEERAEKKAKYDAIPEAVALKFTWQLVARPSDEALFAIAKKRGVQCVPTVYGTRVAGRLSDGPRENILSEEFYQDRVLRVQVMGPICEPISSIGHIPKLQRAFIGCLKAHRELYTKGRILHRNITLNKLMAKISGEGYIFDLENAINTDGYPLVGLESASPIPPPVVGVPSFSSVEFFEEGGVPVHFYRHDLESFYYSLAWLATHYRRGELAYTSVFHEWTSGSPTQVLASKKAYMEAAASGTWKYTYPTEITQTWLRRLSVMFHDAYTAWDSAKLAGSAFDGETLGGHVTYEKFLEILESKDDVEMS